MSLRIGDPAPYGSSLADRLGRQIATKTEANSQAKGTMDTNALLKWAAIGAVAYFIAKKLGWL